MKTNQVRIIGGKWRGRKIVFPEQSALRPTHDRIRETLFNWIAAYLPGANCLDLFAGSGVIGFEAVSRGAATVVLVDQDVDVIQQLERNKKNLLADNVAIIKASVLEDKLELPVEKFDIVFVDPPFYGNLLQPACHWLSTRAYVKSGSVIYLESEINYEKRVLPDNWVVIKHKRTATVLYSLIEVQ